MSNPIINHLIEADRWTQKIQLVRNDFLISKGQTERNIYFVKFGTLRVYLIDNLEELTIRFGYAGTLFTALDSFITGKPTQYYIQALKKSELWAMKKEAYLDLLNSNEEMLKAHNKLMELMVVQQMERETDLLTASPAERYRRVQERSPHLFQEIPSKYIASYLRMTPETLSRLKKP